MTHRVRLTVQAWRSAWRLRTSRERRALQAGAGLLTLLLIWLLAIQPVWSVWREAPARQARIDALTRQMLQLQAQAKKLQTPAHIGRREALDELRAATDRLLGPGAQLQQEGEQLRVTLQATPAAALAQWLSVARDKARAKPRQAELQRADGPDRNATLWQGFLLMQLP